VSGKPNYLGNLLLKDVDRRPQLEQVRAGVNRRTADFARN
jgi:hypothetical protein